MFPATSPGWCSPPAEKSLHGQEVLPTSHCKDPPPTPQGRRAGGFSARCRHGLATPRGGRPEAGQSILRAAPGPRCRRPRASPRPYPPQLEAEGRAGAGLRDGGAGGGGRLPAGPGAEGPAGWRGMAARRPGAGPRPAAPWRRRRRLMGAGIMAEHNKEASQEGGGGEQGRGRGKGGLLRPRRAGRSAPPRSAVRRRGATPGPGPPARTK